MAARSDPVELLLDLFVQQSARDYQQRQRGRNMEWWQQPCEKLPERRFSAGPGVTLAGLLPSTPMPSLVAALRAHDAKTDWASAVDDAEKAA